MPRKLAFNVLGKAQHYALDKKVNYKIVLSQTADLFITVDKCSADTSFNIQKKKSSIHESLTESNTFVHNIQTQSKHTCHYIPSSALKIKIKVICTIYISYTIADHKRQTSFLVYANMTGI